MDRWLPVHRRGVDEPVGGGTAPSPPVFEDKIRFIPGCHICLYLVAKKKVSAGPPGTRSLETT